MCQDKKLSKKEKMMNESLDKLLENKQEEPETEPVTSVEESAASHTSVHESNLKSLSRRELEEMAQGDLHRSDLAERAIFYEVKGEDRFDWEIYHCGFYSTRNKADIAVILYTEEAGRRCSPDLQDEYWVIEWSYERFIEHETITAQKMGNEADAFLYTHEDHIHSVAAEAVKNFKEKMNAVTVDELHSYHYKTVDGALNPYDDDFFTAFCFVVLYSDEEIKIGAHVTANNGYQCWYFSDSFDSFEELLDWLDGDMDLLIEHFTEEFKERIHQLEDSIE